MQRTDRREKAVPGQHDLHFRKVLTQERIQQAVCELAEAIERDHAAGEPLLIVAAMKGAIMFLADLIRQLPIPLEIELVNARSYEGTQRQAMVQVTEDLAELSLTGRRVLLLDCVLDTGNTLAHLTRAISLNAPASLRTCVLVRKLRQAPARLAPDYVGADVPDTFIVGYGLDHRNRWRHLPYIAELPVDLQS